MNTNRSRAGAVSLAVAAVSLSALCLAPGAWSEAPTSTGPSSSASPYLVPTLAGVTTESIITVGDTASNGYRMVGIPDGLGAFANDDGTFTVLMNHELGSDKGIPRAHGSVGAFVSKLIVDKSSLEVLSGQDLISEVYTPAANGTWAPLVTAFNRFCSADLADRDAFWDARSKRGTKERIFLNGEEAGPEGRAFGHVVTGAEAGKSFELPALGNLSFENVIALPDTGKKTVVVVTDDTGGGEIYVYVGEKQRTGNAVERAGLTNGRLFGLKVDGLAVEDDTTTVPDESSMQLVEVPGAATLTGAQIEAASVTLGLTRFARPEDASWDPSDHGGLYVATTGSFTNISRLWHFEIDEALTGGTAEIAFAGPAYDPLLASVDQAGPRMMDNLTVNRRGEVLAQEDPGNQEYVAGIWRWDPDSGSMTRVAQHDPDRFKTGAAGFLTTDEESSGIIPLPFLGSRTYLADTQAHYASGDAETVEGGQLVLLTVPRAKHK